MDRRSFLALLGVGVGVVGLSVSNKVQAHMESVSIPLPIPLPVEATCSVDCNSTPIDDLARQLSGVWAYYKFAPIYSVNEKLITNAMSSVCDLHFNDRRLHQYDVICNATNNTPDMCARGDRAAHVYVQRTGSLDWIEYTFSKDDLTITTIRM